MKFCNWFYLVAALPLGSMAAEVPAPVTEVQIFRGGQGAVIRHEAAPKGAKVFTVTGNFSPLEGTLWSSPNVRQIRKTITEISRKEPVSLYDITATYKNQFVTLILNNGAGKTEKVKGTVIDAFKKEQPPHSSFVVLKCTQNNQITTIAIPRDQILRVESGAFRIAERTVKEKKQAWEFTLASQSAKIDFDYMAKTLNWTPSLKLTLLPGNKFSLINAATIVNTGDELKNARCILWAGAPNIENSAVFSPMAIVKKAIPVPLPQPRAAVWKRSNGPAFASFAATDHAVGDEGPVSAPDIVNNMVPFDAGRITLKKSEALFRPLGRAGGSYENLVRWRISPRQADNGRRVWKTGNNILPEMWECLQFVNPFKHPIPDAAVEISDGSRVLAQIKGSWVNITESATWEISRCQDVKAIFVEQEAPSSLKNRGVGLFQRIDRKNPSKNSRAGTLTKSGSSGAVTGGVYNGNWYRVTDIKGYIQLKNYRKSPVKLVIEMDYLGEFVSSSGKPVKKALNHFGSLNPKNQLIWQITLKPGEKRKLDFRYNIIINR